MDSTTSENASSGGSSLLAMRRASLTLARRAILLRLYVRILHDLHPAGVLAAHEGAELRRRHRLDFRSVIDQPLTHRRVGQDGGDGRVDLLHDIGGNALRADQRAPRPDLEFAHAPLR